MKKIKIVVDEEGNINRDFQGFKGKSCLKEAKNMDKEMENIGIVIENKKIKKKTEAEIRKEVISMKGGD